MEEILSSIKRIIAEEGEGPTRTRRTPRATPAPALAQPPAPVATPSSYFDDEDDSEVLELSDPMPATADHHAEEAVAVPEPRVEPTIVAARPAPRAVPSAPAAVATPDAEPILSERTAEVSRSALDSLTRAIAQPEPAVDKGDDNTLDGVVRAMLRPMLREWLDTNLPTMVEEMVAIEIARITSQPR